MSAGERHMHDVLADAFQRGLTSVAYRDAIAPEEMQHGGMLPAPPPVKRVMQEQWSYRRLSDSASGRAYGLGSVSGGATH